MRTYRKAALILSALFISVAATRTGEAQAAPTSQELAAKYQKDTGAPLDGAFRPSALKGVEEAYLTPIDPSSHAANLLQLKNGDVLCFWFSGTWEGRSGVSIVMSRLARGSRTWTVPVKVAGKEGESYQNPVAFQAPDGTLWLFNTTQKANAGQSHALALVSKSRDNGKTWSASEIVFEQPGVFVRQPLVIMPNGNWMLPLYYTPGENIVKGAETNYSAVKISADRGKTWKECVIPKSDGFVQPSVVYQHGHYIAFFRSRYADYIYRSTSEDGCAWTEPAKTTLPNNNSSIQAALLKDGKVAMAFNNVGSVSVKGKPTAGPRRPLSVTLSADEGSTWPAIRDLERGRLQLPLTESLPKEPGREEYSYPAILQLADGRIMVVFTYLRETMKAMIFPESWIADQK